MRLLGKNSSAQYDVILGENKGRKMNKTRRFMIGRRARGDMRLGTFAPTPAARQLRT
jgi:hypothetical protein